MTRGRTHHVIGYPHGDIERQAERWRHGLIAPDAGRILPSFSGDHPMSLFRTFRSTFSAIALSAGLVLGTLGATTTTARADSGDAVRLLGGLIALYAIGRALDVRNDRQQPSRQYYSPSLPAPQHQSSARPQQRIAPDQCYREFQTRDGYFRGYAGPCLQRSVRHGLPDACAREFRTDRGRQVFYGGRCMAQNGWVQETRRGY
jgi:hypothetical protein